MRLMPTLCLPLRARTLALAAVWLCLALGAARAAQAPARAPAKPAGHSPAPTNAAPAEPELPKSVFINPATPQEGRDPFFPNSTRRAKTTVITTSTNPPVVVVELQLKGISGSADRRLAIINNRTFEAGEEGTVLSDAGRVRILCKEIGADSVRVVLNGQERTLTLRGSSATAKSGH